MKLLVKKIFSDKYTGDFYKVNDVIEVSNERGKELLNHTLDLVEEIKEDADTVINQIVDEAIEEFKQEIEAKNISEDTIVLEAKAEKKKSTRKKKVQED